MGRRDPIAWRAEAEPVRPLLGSILAVGIWSFTELLGYTGGLFVIYSIVSWMANDPWPLIERYAPFFSSLLTLLGTTLTAGSVYFRLPSQRAPWRHSKYLYSPIVIVSSVVAIGVLLSVGQLSQVAISGFGMLAISGGLKRLLPYPVEAGTQRAK